MMNSTNHVHDKNATDAGLLTLVTLLRYLGISADPEQIRHRFQLDVARLRAALTGSDDPVSEFRPSAAAPPSLVAMQRQFLVSQTGEFAAKLAALDRQRAQKEAERATNRRGARRQAVPPSGGVADRLFSVAAGRVERAMHQHLNGTPA